MGVVEASGVRPEGPGIQCFQQQKFFVVSCSKSKYYSRFVGESEDSMRVLMPNGNLLSIKKAIAVAEMRVAFNGRDIRLCEKASDIAAANAIVFLPEAGVQDICDVTMGGTALLGNLKNDLVRGVLASLVRQGYVDLSDLKLQKTQPLVSQYKFDNGTSGAYLIFGYEASACLAAVPGYPFMGMAAPAVNNAEDSEDAEDAGEEDDDE